MFILSTIDPLHQTEDGWGMMWDKSLFQHSFRLENTDPLWEDGVSHHTVNTHSDKEFESSGEVFGYTL